MTALAYTYLVLIAAVLLSLRRFGAPEPSAFGTEKSEKVWLLIQEQVRIYRLHEKRLFALAWVGALCGLILGAWAISRLLATSPDAGGAVLEGLPALGSLVVGGSAWSMYLTVGKKIEALLTTLIGQGPE